MASIITADTGAVSGSAGLKQSADSSGILALATGTGTTAVTIDTSQNAGVGVVPSAWAGGNTALQMAGPAMWGASGVSHWSTNTYFDGSNYKYIATGPVMDYYQYNGAHVLRASDSGSAGANVSTFANLISVAKGQTLALQGASSQTGTGISFPVDQNASADARTLDDYEEGIWTPSLGSTGSTPTVSSYATRTGSYTKVGNLVTATCSIRATLSNAGTGYPVITGLPFTSDIYLDGVAIGIVDIANNVSTSTGLWYVSGTYVYAGSGMTYNTSSNRYMTFTVSYRVA